MILKVIIVLTEMRVKVVTVKSNRIGKLHIQMDYEVMVKPCFATTKFSVEEIG